MEGVAFTLADALDCLEAAGDRLGAIGLIGGGARSALWTRMIASTLRRPITRYRGGETGPAFGAARLARLAATGEAPEDVCAAPPVLDVTDPDPGLAERLKRKLDRFRSLYRALKPEFAAT
jgi:xylulokinase